MDLKNKIPSMRGQVQWVDGYQLLIGPDGIARNVPAEAAEKLLKHPEAWVQVHDAGPAKGLMPTGFTFGAQPQRPPQVQVVEINLTPRSVQFLERLTQDELSEISRAFNVDPTFEGTPSQVAREIIAAADAQLEEQLRQILKPAAPKAEPAPAAAEPVVPAKKSKKKVEAKADEIVVETKEIPQSTVEDIF